MTPPAAAFHVVLVEPEIPPNTGNIGRLCVAAGATLHLVHPLGFSLDERSLRRAGLDYWPHLRLKEWPDWATFAAARVPADRWFLFSTKASRPYTSQRFEAGDFLIFGRETRGLPETLLAEHPGSVLHVPMRPEARSINLGTCVGIVLYEAIRQQG